MQLCPNCKNLVADDARFCGRCGCDAQSATASDSGPPADEDLTGQTMAGGRYQLRAQLGVGGMGAVYHATDLRLRRDVALKILHAELVAHPTARRRMTQEAQALARIEHPNVVRVFDVFDEGPKLAMALEFVTGGDLSARIVPGGLPESQVVPLMCAILAGLEAVHQAGLVHRDMKPGNVLLTDKGVPKVTDLGVARDAQAKERTSMGTALGTPEYMSPEQVQGLVVDARCDVYAAGIVLFELLTGQKPYNATSDFEIATAHVHTPPNLDLLRGRASDKCLAVVSKALAKRPDDRFASAQAMADELQRPSAPRAAPRATAAAPPSVVLTAPAVQAQVVREIQPARPVTQPTRRRAVDTDQVAAVTTPAPAQRLPLILAGSAVAIVAVIAVAFAMQGGKKAAPYVSASTPEPAAQERRWQPAEPAQTPEPEPAAAPSAAPAAAPRAARAPAWAPSGESPDTAVTAYYAAINDRDESAAARRFAIWGTDRWRSNIYSKSGCAKVISASTISRDGSEGVVSVDVCVQDTSEPNVKRWQGTIDVEERGGIWVMKKWRVRGAGTCSSDCSL